MRGMMSWKWSDEGNDELESDEGNDELQMVR